MSQADRSILHKLAQIVASSRLGAWFFSQNLHHLDRIIFRLSGQRTTLSGILSGLPLIMLTTQGAKSGLPRRVPLLCFRDPESPQKLGLIASNWGQQHHPAWYHNLKANPRATGTLNGHTIIYQAHEAQGGEYDRFWKTACEAYPGYPLYRQRARGRRIPILVLIPEDPPANE